uniref:Meiosis-specific nuclear structural protein 1 n=1 Tax=Polyblepharides amylifera TaxID=1486889 RepID=A0A7R9SVN5_9CHLO|mmetsp:Transcript_73/g.95  ORF Transcript_73/g.95 Transcript_73/m.95 type:complete len:487 (+) Transcript_73:151-1611(+)|eukprot:CAMPEP_0196574938 /NCGR_PEP_ID=MMETSP1081-20130531/4530_1 /TAXON_ID=36882 /ORGANISM="Pyramimonas amylifera, Strain CCMP720" /LENGTH=486 /DNA_ID=CAMNT_0041893085 /DNA_START=32 /DNA_END=1492 /DNA_ORIENTATION=-
MASKRNNLLRAQDAREQRRREDEYSRGNLQKYINDETMLRGNLKYDERSEHVRREREARARAQEEGHMEELYVAHKTKQFAANSAEEDAKIAAHLEKVHKEDEISQRLVQRVRNESEELRWLQEKLRTAEVSMLRKLQVDEKHIIKERDVQYNSQMDAQMELGRQKVVEAENLKEQRRREDQLGARYVQEEQMEEKLALQRAAVKEFERERAAVDEIVANIQLEDQAEVERKKAKQDETRRWVVRFMEEREKLRESARRAEWEEEERIRQYGQKIEQRRMGEAQKAQMKQDEADRILKKMSQEKEREVAKKAELEELLARLHFEEQEARYRQVQADKNDKNERSRLEMMQANDFQKQLKAQRRQKEIEEEEEYRRRMMQKFAEDERLEAEGVKRRNEKMDEFKKEVQGLAQHKHSMYEKQKAVELAEFMKHQNEENRRESIIEEERLRMLREHAVKLMDYLPKGVLQRPEDLDMLVELLNERMGRQ